MYVRIAREVHVVFFLGAWLSVSVPLLFLILKRAKFFFIYRSRFLRSGLIGADFLIIT